MIFKEGSESNQDIQNPVATKFSPDAVDQMIRQAIGLCWMMLPDDKKNVDIVVAEIRRLVERALSNLREDAELYAAGTKGDSPR